MNFFTAMVRTTFEGACQTVGGEIAKSALAWIEKRTGKTFLVKDAPPTPEEKLLTDAEAAGED